MHNIEIEDFYHHDFTTASEWEVFIARLEEIIHEWKLPQTKIGPSLKAGDFVNLKWEQKTEELNFADVGFTLKHFKLQIYDEESVDGTTEDFEDGHTQAHIDSLNVSNDFVLTDVEHLEIARYYGLREFIVLVPSKRSPIFDETRTKILVSSLTIAANNANCECVLLVILSSGIMAHLLNWLGKGSPTLRKMSSCDHQELRGATKVLVTPTNMLVAPTNYCEIPALVQVQEQWQKFYLGISVGRGTSTHLDMIHLKKTPPHCRYLTGLLALFKQKIGEGCGVRLDPAMVSARFSYVLKDWTNFTWTQEPPDFDFMQGETVGVAELGKLPFGATFDPVGELTLFTTWPQMSENVVVDSEGFTDFEPQLGPEWFARVKMVASPACLLGEYLTDFIHSCNSQKSMTDLLGDAADCSGDANDQMLSSAFNILTESRIPTISNVVNKAASKRSKNVEGPISEQVLVPILYFLFPDADDNQKAPYGDINAYSVEDDPWRGVKTCAVDGLVWRLAIVAAHCAHNLGGAMALAQVWHEFVQEIRYRWEKSIMIPGVGTGYPDSVRTCILHQKLQMINCCVEREKAREETAHRPQIMDMDFDSDSEEEDEFFECTSDESAKLEEQPTKTHAKSKQLLWNRPTGRLARHPTLRLIKTGDALYLPVTQDPVPKTEDQLEEDAQVMMQLGTDKYASEMRARLMSASLLSDMESFKAANPDAQLEDFIRWYSPRDWVEAEGIDEWGQPAGNLSPRMKIPNNPWATTWSSAQPVPAHRQKRLFDDTREAEKVIHYLTSKTIGQVAQLLLPVLTHAALYTLSQQKQSAMPNLPEVTQSILNKLQYATKPIHQKLQLYEEIARDIEGIEALVAQANSLQHKLCGNDDSKELTSFIVQLMRGREVPVPGGARGNIGVRITTMFRDAQKAAYMMTSARNSNESDASGDGKQRTFPEPSCKEFILRAITPRPSPTSTPQPQRMYACLKRDYIRLAGFFSEDTTFL